MSGADIAQHILISTIGRVPKSLVHVDASRTNTALDCRSIDIGKLIGKVVDRIGVTTVTPAEHNDHRLVQFHNCNLGPRPGIGLVGD